MVAIRSIGGGREMGPRRNVRILKVTAAAVALLLLGGALFNFTAVSKKSSDRRASHATYQQRLFAKGKRIFRFATFGDQDHWGGALKLHLAIEGSRLGGVGPGLSPKAALGAGLKVDVNALPPSLVKALKRGEQGGKCALCQQALPARNAVLDRIEAMLGYTPENTRLLCPQCDNRIQAERGFA